MPLVDHLRELRRRLVICLLALIPGTAAGFVFYQPISDLLTAPVCHLQVTGVAPGQCGPLVITGSLLAPFTLQAKVAMFSGFVLSAPVWLYQLWAFVAPGLHKHEKRWSMGFVAAGIPLFLAGGALCYVLLPQGVAFLISFKPENVGLIADYHTYLSLVLRLILVFGFSFLMPIFVIALNLAGILPAARLREWWRGVVVAVMIFAAVATPTGDPLTMLALAIPVLLLVAVAYGICLLNDRARRRSRAEDYADLPDNDLSPL